MQQHYSFEGHQPKRKKSMQQPTPKNSEANGPISLKPRPLRLGKRKGNGIPSNHMAFTPKKTDTPQKIQLLIVGGGPAGLTAGIYAGRANLEPIIAVGGFHGGSMVPGGQLMITTEVENYPGFPDGISGPDLMARFQEQAKHFGGIIVEEFATEFKLKPGGPHMVKVGSQWYETEAIILAMGAQARWLGAPDEQLFINKGISACATCDGPLPVYRNKHILVVGGGDSAMEEATFLAKFAAKVSIVVRRDQLRASKIMQDRALSNPKIEVLWNTLITGYYGDDDFLKGVHLVNTQSGEKTSLDVGGVFMAIGHEPCTVPVKDSGLKLDESNYVSVHDHIFTNIDGVFAAGDIHDIHFKQAVSAAGFGCMSAIAAERWLETKHATSKSK